VGTGFGAHSDIGHFMGWLCGADNMQSARILSGNSGKNVMTFYKAMLAALLLGGIAFGSAQITSTDNSRHPGSQPSVSLNLLAVPMQVKPSGSLLLKISLHNISTKDILVGYDIGSGAVDYDVFVVDDQGIEPPTTAFCRFVKGKRLPGDPRFYSTYSRPTVLVQPGKSQETTINLEKLYGLDHAGVYKVWVERFDGISMTRVQSNTITVTVTR
jgi:hypothetical protein